MEKKIRHTTNTGKERVYNFLVEFIKENGFPPSVMEISAGCGLKPQPQSMIIWEC